MTIKTALSRNLNCSERLPKSNATKISRGHPTGQILIGQAGYERLGEANPALQKLKLCDDDM